MIYEKKLGTNLLIVEFVAGYLGTGFSNATATGNYRSCRRRSVLQVERCHSDPSRVDFTKCDRAIVLQ